MATEKKYNSYPEHNLLVFTYWSFKEALIQTYTLPYLKIISKQIGPGSKIYLITIEKPELMLKADEMKRVEKELTEYNIELILIPYKRFGLSAIFNWSLNIFFLVNFCRRQKISGLHAFCTPAGSIGYIISVITGIPLVLDSYEPHAEAMVENGTWKKYGIAYRFLYYLEKRQSKRARAVIAATGAMKDYARIKYKTVPEHFFVKPACVDLNLFSGSNFKNVPLLSDLGLNDKIVCVYAGKFGGIYLDREVFDFFKVCSDYWGEKFGVLLLTNHDPGQIKNWINVSGLKASIITNLFVEHAKIADYIGLADFAITPVKSVPSKKYCTPIKDGEYWALGLPVVITHDISDDSAIIEKENIGAVIESLDHNSYLRVVKKIDSLFSSEPRKALRNRIRKVAIKYRSFEIAELVYSKVYLNSNR